MDIIFLYHSGILLENDEVQIFIDPISYVNERIDIEKRVYFLVTHSHQDHYDQNILNYTAPNVHYVLSDDIHDRPKYNYTGVKPDENYVVGDLEIDTYGSTDRGVSFLVNCDDHIIFHSGDLNWWHWENDEISVQLAEEKAFKEIAECVPSKIDVAFIPYDPRLGNAKNLAIEYYLDHKQIDFIVPIHFRNHTDVCDTFSTKLKSSSSVICVGKVNSTLFSL